MKEHWQSALKLLAEVLQEPGFPEEGVARVLRDHNTALKRIADDPVSISERLIRGKLFGPETPYGHPISGTEESVARIEHDDLVSFHRSGALSGIDQMTLIVVGDVTEEEVLQVAGPLFGSRSTAKFPEESGYQPLAAQSNSAIWLVDKPGLIQSTPTGRRHADSLAGLFF